MSPSSAAVVEAEAHSLASATWRRPRFGAMVTMEDPGQAGVRRISEGHPVRALPSSWKFAGPRETIIAYVGALVAACAGRPCGKAVESGDAFWQAVGGRSI